MSAREQCCSPTVATTAMPSARNSTEQGARANIRPLEHRVVRPRFSPKAYRQRNLVERFFNKLKHYRAIATRFCRHDANYLASVQLAALRIWLRFNESVTF